MAQAPVGMNFTRYLGSECWVQECSHANAFDAYIDARRRCVLRGCSYLLVDAETGSKVLMLTVRHCLHQYGVEGGSGVIASGDRRRSRQDGGF